MALVPIGVLPVDALGHFGVCADGSPGQIYRVTIDTALLDATNGPSVITNAVLALGAFQATPNDWQQLMRICAGIGYLLGLYVQNVIDHP